MSLPDTPAWSLLHIGMKFPSAAVVAGGAFMLFAESPKPMVAITFDDGRKSIYEVALPEMQERGLVGTLFLNAVEDTDTYINPKQIQEFVDLEWEIASHGLDHVDMTAIDDIELERQMLGSMVYLANLTGQEILSVATPFGYFNEKVLAATEKVYFYHANAWSPANGVNTVDDFDTNNINRIDITQDVSVEYVCNAIDNLEEDSLYVILFHDIIEGEHDNPEMKWKTSPEKFNAILDCIEDADVNVGRFADTALAMMEKQK